MSRIIENQILTLYGHGHTITLEELLLLANMDRGSILARAEFSGSESCYCEVARWNYERSRWERYAFIKLMDVNIDGLRKDRDKAVAIADLINSFGGSTVSLIHNMPNYV
jgi:hypothetical protein